MKGVISVLFAAGAVMAGTGKFQPDARGGFDAILSELIRRRLDRSPSRTQSCS